MGPKAATWPWDSFMTEANGEMHVLGSGTCDEDGSHGWIPSAVGSPRARQLTGNMIRECSREATESRHVDGIVRTLEKVIHGMVAALQAAEKMTGGPVEPPSPNKKPPFDSTSKDPHDAVKIYRRAAEQGKAQGQFSLGWCCENGWGMHQDLAAAFKWYN
eukprot:gene3898-4859_t